MDCKVVFHQGYDWECGRHQVTFLSPPSEKPATCPVAKEREACAKVAEDFFAASGELREPGFMALSMHIADAIRARKT